MAMTFDLSWSLTLARNGSLYPPQAQNASLAVTVASRNDNDRTSLTSVLLSLLRPDILSFGSLPTRSIKSMGHNLSIT